MAKLGKRDKARDCKLPLQEDFRPLVDRAPGVANRGSPLLKLSAFCIDETAITLGDCVGYFTLNILPLTSLVKNSGHPWFLFAHCCLFWGNNVLHGIHSESVSHSNILCFLLGVFLPLPPSWESDGISFALGDSQFGFRTMWTYRERPRAFDSAQWRMYVG